MTDIPSAHIENRPWHRRPGIRKAAGAVLIVAALFGAWKLLKHAMRSESSKQLEARQDAARAFVGNGLDKLFEEQLDVDSNIVTLAATLAVGSGLGSGYSESDCATGFGAAFEQALGKDVVLFSAMQMSADRGPRLEMTAKLTSSGRSFQLPHSAKEYPGLAMSADIKFVGKTIHVQVEPGADIEFTRVVFGIDLDGVSDSDVNSGILQGTCKEAGLRLLESITTWKRPPPPPAPDPVAECERGFHCSENAQALEDDKPDVAVKLYAKACDHDDEDACVRGATISMGLSPDGLDEHAARARVMLDMACHRELARACMASGKVRLIPFEAGKPPSAYQRAEALEVFLRACDLGERDACAEVVPLLEGTPFAEAAPLLTGAASVTSKTLGTLFALRWGQWSKFDNGQPTMWVTKRPATLSEGVVTEFRIDKLPKSIVPPEGVETVYAIALERGHGQHDTACMHCMPSGRPTGAFAMQSLDCVCALSPNR